MLDKPHIHDDAPQYSPHDGPIDCIIKSTRSETSQLPSSRKGSQHDPLNVPPPSSFRRKVRSETKLPGETRSNSFSGRQNMPRALLSSIRQSIASEIARCESACWYESSVERCEWQDAFKAFEKVSK